MSRIRRTYLPQPLANQMYGPTRSYAPSTRRTYGSSTPAPVTPQLVVPELVAARPQAQAA